jgi:hypothetical protein
VAFGVNDGDEVVGVNDRGTIAGFYTDSAGNTDGLLAKAAK